MTSADQMASDSFKRWCDMERAAYLESLRTPPPDAPSVEFMLLRSNALLAAAMTLKTGDPMLDRIVGPRQVEELAARYEAFLMRPVGAGAGVPNDQAQAA